MADLGYTSSAAKYSSRGGGAHETPAAFFVRAKEEARQEGVHVPKGAIIPDGKMHRYRCDPKDTKQSCRYVAHSDGVPNIQFYDHRRSSEPVFFAKGSMPNGKDRAHIAEEAKANQAKREAEDAERHANAATEAERIWGKAGPADPNHGYLVDGHVKPHGIQQIGDELVIPIRRDGKLASLQFIDAGGDKRYLKDAQKQGGCFIVGDTEDADTICIAEGYRTAATIYEATGIPCVVAFDAGNLLPVAQALKAAFPTGVEFIVCADDDHMRPGNPGLTKAREAAAAIGAWVAKPDFGEGEHREEKATDFNDMVRLRGPASVLECLRAAEFVAGDADQGTEAKSETEASIADACREAIRQKYRFDGDPVPPLPPALIKGMLPRTGTGLLIGQSGAGKTFIMIDLALALASNGAFFGKDVRTRVGVCFITAEGANSFNRRIDAGKKHRDVNEILPIAYLPFSGDLTKDDEFKQLLAELPVIDAMFREEHGVPLGLVVLDTMSATFAMKDQNSAAEVTAVCKRLKQIGEKVNVFAFGVHHLGKDETKDAAGSFAWRANVDIMWSAIATGDRVRGKVDRREFCIAKNRDGREGPISGYDFVEIDLGVDEDGDPKISLAIEPKEAVRSKKPAKPINADEKAFADAFNECAIATPIKHRVERTARK